MNVAAYREFEAYSASVQDADVRMMLPTLDRPSWEIAGVSVGEFHVQRGREGSGNIAEGTSRDGGQVLFVPLTGRNRANGILMDDCDVLVMEPGSEFSIAVHEAHDWCSVFVPFESTSANEATSSRLALEKRETRIVKTSRAESSRLRWLLSQVVECAISEPSASTIPAAQRSLTADLESACRPVVRRPLPGLPNRGRPLISRQGIVRKANEWFDRQSENYGSVSSLANVVGVTERTLQNAFLDCFGVPPRRYFALRRLQQARTALRTRDPDRTSVTEVAARFGFWHFGRFSREYFRHFGERPSETALVGASKRPLRVS